MIYHDFSTGNELLDEGIENFLMYGLEPGGFLQAVLTNDLFLAAGRADHQNKARLAEIANTVYHNLPAMSFGNRQNVQDWLADVDKIRSNYAYCKEKEYTYKVLKGEIHVGWKKIKTYPF